MSILVIVTFTDSTTGNPVAYLPYSYTWTHAADALGLYGGSGKGSGKSGASGTMSFSVANIGFAGNDYNVTVNVLPNTAYATDSKSFAVTHIYNNSTMNVTYNVTENTELSNHSSGGNNNGSPPTQNGSQGWDNFINGIAAAFNTDAATAQTDIEIIGIVGALVIVLVVVLYLGAHSRSHSMAPGVGVSV